MEVKLSTASSNAEAPHLMAHVEMWQVLGEKWVGEQDKASRIRLVCHWIKLNQIDEVMNQTKNNRSTVFDR